MKDMSLWSASVNGNTPLREITLPGSHDAGIYPEDYNGRFALKSQVVCQDGTILQQCMWGSRFFDLRVERSGVPFNKKVRAFHKAGDIGPGGVGGTADRMLSDVDQFLSSRGSEFVILRISHTDKSSGILDLIWNHPIREKLFKGTGNIATTTINQLRGKAICVFDSKEFKNLDQSQGYHPFAKYKSSSHDIVGLQTCGEFASSKDVATVLAKQLARTDEHFVKHQNKKDHLFVLYWTQTGGNIRANTTAGEPWDPYGLDYAPHATGGTHHNMDYMIDLLKGQYDNLRGETFNRTEKTPSGHWYTKDQKTTVQVRATTWSDRREQMPNVIMYDFVNEATSEKIVLLNEPNLQGFLVEKRVPRPRVS